MEELARLKHQRAQLKSRLTRFITFLNSPENRSKIMEIKKRLENLSPMLAEYEDVHSQIQVHDSTQATDADITNFENQYFQTISDAEKLIIDSAPAPAAPTIVNATNNAPAELPSRLPDVQIPSFSGSYTDWIPFRDSFQSIINDNKTLSNVQKFHYLQSTVKGEAWETIQHFTISNDTYQEAWDSLKSRYENNRLIVQHHVRAICSLPTIHKDPKSARALLHTVLTNLKGLRALKRPTDQWDDLLIELVSSKFDTSTTLAWEATLSSNIPTFEDLTKFLTQRCQMLESLNNSNSVNYKNQTGHSFKFHKTINFSNNSSRPGSHLVTNQTSTCQFCKQSSHILQQCKEFLSLKPIQRLSEIKKRKLCTNCLRGDHKFDNCSSGNCRKCNKRHNSLLHIENSESNTNQVSQSHVDKPEYNNNRDSQSSTSTICAQILNKNIVLSTAIVKVVDKNGKLHHLRALLDSGSQSNFISESACKQLGLSCRNINLPVIGINQNSTKITKTTSVKIESCHNSFKFNLSCLVIPTITQNIPGVTFDASKLNIPDKITLADPKFNIAAEIDLLIGNEHFWQLMCKGQIYIQRKGPVIQQTKLGWILAGAIPIYSQNQPTQICNFSQISDLEQQIDKFWNIEEFDSQNKFNEADAFCENYITTTLTRNADGRFVVKLPFKNDPPQLGETKHIAINRLKSLERKFLNDPQLQTSYYNFMREYLQMGHMRPLSAQEVREFRNVSYLPHHAVFKESSNTTKVRVVFDGSAKSTNGLSLNDNLHVGPSLQQELFAILTRFRTHQYVLTADIAKMYRMIIVDQNDAKKYQRIVWRFGSDEPIKTYCLNTVTYGLACSPYLAIRCLQEVARIESLNFPETSKIILRDFFVDDVMTGGSTIEEVLKIRDDLIAILKKGGFELRQWSSNNKNLLPDPNSETKNQVNLNMMQPDKKVLGVCWNCESDYIYFSVFNNDSNDKITKRTILSTIARLFDPIGLITPITVTAKVILQKIWSIKLDWDESVPENISNMWISFLQEFQHLNKLTIPRKVISNQTQIIELHGFCDASKTSYGACVYIRCKLTDGNYSSNLLCSKNKVAPLKPITIPRLELLAALLLGRLVNKITTVLNISINDHFLWTDSTIVLAWLSTQPTKLKPFVANRVAELQKLTRPSNWSYINTKTNPADILSRGTTPKILEKSTLWWHGPQFLLKDTSQWPKLDKEKGLPPDEIPDIKKICCLTAHASTDLHLLTKYSSFDKLIRITAYCLRFINNIQQKNEKRFGSVTCGEVKKAHQVIMRLTQEQAFHNDIHSLKKYKKLPKSSKLQSLNPFLDDVGLLRVGGRLRNAPISYDTKHQILLPKNHHITNLIIIKEHALNLHAGCQATLAAIRQKYWPISGRNTVRQVLHKCIKCYRTKPTTYEQLMGDLPLQRVAPSRPFSCSAVDYAGPIILKNGHGRTTKTIKSFIVIFVCLATRAVHIELVCDYTSTSFLNALKRFISRRGKISYLISDNAKNFVGANRELKEVKLLLQSDQFQSDVIDVLANQEIVWSFIPPRAPHMGGLHEAAVKSAKMHLKRVIHNTLLNYEEMYTLLTLIEACLNSRPLVPLSNDPLDPQALTPGHFLIGDSLTAPVEPNTLEVTTNRLTKYQHIVKMRQHFWKRWAAEYRNQLQQRNKWSKTSTQRPQIGTLVLVKEDNAPPLQWPLGRITQLHPGADGLTRVVTVKTVRGEVKRAITKLCALPTNE